MSNLEKKNDKKNINSHKERSSLIKKLTLKKDAHAQTKKTATTKKGTRTSGKKATATKKDNKSNNEEKLIPIQVLEYYDLPHRYNKTVVKLLAQTPNSLFVYWNISDTDRNSYIKEFGENFFDITSPVLVIHNETMNYSYEVEINDFANCWYLNTNNANCKYKIDLIRKVKSNKFFSQEKIIKISSSNDIESPNDHILFENLKDSVNFKNVRTNEIMEKDIRNISSILKLEKVYNIYDLYKKLYSEEDILNNPSSKFF